MRNAGLGEQFLRLFANQDFLSSVRAPAGLLGHKFVLSEAALEIGQDGTKNVVSTSGYYLQQKVSADTARVLSILDGTKDLAQAILGAASRDFQGSPDVEEIVLRDIHQLINLGMIKPVR